MTRDSLTMKSENRETKNLTTSELFNSLSDAFIAGAAALGHVFECRKTSDSVTLIG